jgi:hypothetical protein
MMNKAALRDLLAAYMSALSAGTPDGLSFHPDFRSTENGVTVPVGEGLWSLSPRFAGTHSYSDADTGHAVCMGVVILDAGTPQPFVLRIGAREDQLVEAETIIS